MNEPIKVGDLVRVAYDDNCPHCGVGLELTGTIFVVTEIGFSGGWCSNCFGERKGVMGAHGHPQTQGFVGLHRLRRIPPLSDLESLEHKEETPA